MKRTHTARDSGGLGTSAAGGTLAVLRDTTNNVINRVVDEQTRIVFDLETTGLSREKAEICEIACWVVGDLPNEYNSKEICSLIMPTKPSTKSAVAVNGIRRTGTNQMLVREKYRYNKPPAREVFSDLIQWLKKYRNPVMIAHNGFRFDAQFLIVKMQQEGLFEDFAGTVAYFGDTMTELKPALPGQKHNMDVLGTQFIPGWTEYKKNAHSALFDVWTTMKATVFFI